MYVYIYIWEITTFIIYNFSQISEMSIVYVKCLYKWKKRFLFSQSIYEYFILSDRLT